MGIEIAYIYISGCWQLERGSLFQLHDGGLYTLKDSKISYAYSDCCEFISFHKLNDLLVYALIYACRENMFIVPNVVNHSETWYCAI